MKKLFLLSAALLVAATIFCGCSKDDDGKLSEASIVGEWNLTKCNGYQSYIDGSNKESYNDDCRGDNIRLRFEKDGTGMLKEGGAAWCDFHYEVNGNILRIDYVDRSADEYTIEKLTAKELILYQYEESGYIIWARHLYYERK